MTGPGLNPSSAPTPGAASSAALEPAQEAPWQGSLAGRSSLGSGERLYENVLHFARVLRKAGMPVGTDRVQLALTALQLGGLESRRDFRAALAACLIDRAEHRTLFDQAFHIFWQMPDLEDRMRAMLLPKVEMAGSLPRPQDNRRLSEALHPKTPGPHKPSQPSEEIEFDLDARLTWSEREVLREQDFETMSADEWVQAKRLIQRLGALFVPLATRRSESAQRPGRADGRATLQALARHAGEWDRIAWRRPRVVPAPLVVLADISGSMSSYSRMLLHFVHALAQTGSRVDSFVFGTRLTNISRVLRHKDPDMAVAQVSRLVRDWSGGTRISASLHEFNRVWARRVLRGTATVLLITDGLEHGDAAALSFEMERLSKSCRRLVWLNPLLRFDGFQPKAAGIRAMLPHVDDFRSAHSIDSLSALALALADSRPTRIPPARDFREGLAAV